MTGITKVYSHYNIIIKLLQYLLGKNIGRFLCKFYIFLKISAKILVLFWQNTQNNNIYLL